MTLRPLIMDAAARAEIARVKATRWSLYGGHPARILERCFAAARVHALANTPAGSNLPTQDSEASATSSGRKERGEGREAP
jgi:hypothetical protein